jgi:hypothetical protein
MHTAFMVFGSEDMALMLSALGARCELMTASRVVDLESRFAERRLCDARVINDGKWVDGQLD